MSLVRQAVQAAGVTLSLPFSLARAPRCRRGAARRLVALVDVMAALESLKTGAHVCDPVKDKIQPCSPDAALLAGEGAHGE